MGENWEYYAKISKPATETNTVWLHLHKVGRPVKSRKRERIAVTSVWSKKEWAIMLKDIELKFANILEISCSECEFI
jgi:hypothetical protein